MKKLEFIPTILLLAFSFLLNLTCLSQGEMAAEISLGVGYTYIDLEEDWPGPEPNDYEEVMYHGFVQLYPLIVNNFALGLEVGYQHFYWYEYTNPSYSEGTITATRLMLAGRLYIVERFFMESGFGFYFQEDYSDTGIQTTLGYDVKVSPSMFIPIKVRGDFLFSEGADAMAASFNLGFAYRFSMIKK